MDNNESENLIHRNTMNKNDLLIIHNQKNMPGIHYGYMIYAIDLFAFDDLDFEYKILNTSDDINVIINDLSKKIILSLGNNFLHRYLMYQVENIDPKMVSYNIILSSAFPYVNINVNKMGEEKICDFYGDNDLCRYVYENIDFLKIYDQYVFDIKRLDKNDLEKIFVMTFGKKPKYFYNIRNKILEKLFESKKNEIIRTNKSN